MNRAEFHFVNDHWLLGCINGIQLRLRALCGMDVEEQHLCWEGFQPNSEKIIFGLSLALGPQSAFETRIQLRSKSRADAKKELINLAARFSPLGDRPHVHLVKFGSTPAGLQASVLTIRDSDLQAMERETFGRGAAACSLTTNTAQGVVFPAPSYRYRQMLNGALWAAVYLAFVLFIWVAAQRASVVSFDGLVSHQRQHVERAEYKAKLDALVSSAALIEAFELAAEGRSATETLSMVDLLSHLLGEETYLTSLAVTAAGIRLQGQTGSIENLEIAILDALPQSKIQVSSLNTGKDGTRFTITLTPSGHGS